MAPPSNCPTRAGGVLQLCSISSSSHSMTRPESIRPSPVTSEAPWPGRSGTITRWVATSPGMIPIQWVAFAMGPCSSTTGGPSPPSSTAVEMPASSSRRSVTGMRLPKAADEPPRPKAAPRSSRAFVLVRSSAAAPRPWRPPRPRCRSAAEATRRDAGRASGERPNLRPASAWVISPRRARRAWSDELALVGEGRRRRP